MARRRVPTPVDPAEVTLAALCGRSVAWATREGSVHVTDVGDGRHLCRIDEAAEALEWSPSGAHLRLERSQRHLVWDPARGKKVADVTYATASLMTDDRGDLLVASPSAGVVQGFRLPGLDPVIEIDMRRCSYAVTRLRQLWAPGGGLAVVGHPWTELLDWLLVFPQTLLQSPLTPFATDRECYTSRFVVDRGAPVLAGYGGEEEIVVYRDHDGAEDPDDAGDADGLADVWGFRGLYVRRLSDGRLLQLFPYTPPAPPSPDADVFATRSAVVVVDGQRLHVLSREDGEVVSVVTARRFAADPQRGQVLAIEDARVELIALE